MRLRIAIFSIAFFALVVTILLQLFGPDRNTRRFARSIIDAGISLDSQGVEFRFSRGEREARQGEWPLSAVGPDRVWGGFEFATAQSVPYRYNSIPAVTYFLRVPLWAVDAALVLLIAGFFRSIRRAARRAQRVARNECPACGYDLRATPNQCPECGAQPSRAVA